MVKTKVYLTFAGLSVGSLLVLLFINWMLDNNLETSSGQAPRFLKPSYKFVQRSKFLQHHVVEMDELNRLQVSMDDPRLINMIRNYWIDNPSELDYNLQFPELLDPSAGQAAFVDNRMNFKENGFYVECGGLDGETRSNTLMLERLRKWHGLLIEADPSNYQLLRKKNRKAFSVNACLSIYPYPVRMQFIQRFNTGKLIEKEGMFEGKKGEVIEVQCFPPYSILLALNITHIDFFSLDVEGDELKVLQTIPFDRVDIYMMTVEYKHIDFGEEYLKNYVESKGYDSLVKIGHYRNWANDIIFRKKTVL